MMMMKNTELIARLKNCGMPGSLEMQAADALEAAQAEIATANSEAVQWKNDWQVEADKLDAALARLAEIEKQAPVGWIGTHPRTGAVELCVHTPAPSVIADFKMEKVYKAAGASPEPSQAASDIAYTVAIQRAIETHCDGKVISKPLYALCPHHAKMLNDKMVQPSQAVELTQAEAEALAHRRASRYTHRTDPTYVAYTFLPHTLMDFVRDVTAAINAKGSL